MIKLIPTWCGELLILLDKEDIEFINRFGVKTKREKLPTYYKKQLKKEIKTIGGIIPNGCFDNAFNLARFPKYTYVEGFAQRFGFWFHHAWNIDAKGRIIDISWKRADTTSTYYGVPLNNIQYRKLTEDNGHNCVFKKRVKFREEIYTRYQEELPNGR